MNTDKIIAELRTEIALVEKVIAELEDLSQRRSARITRERKPFGAATQKQMALVQKKGLPTSNGPSRLELGPDSILRWHMAEDQNTYVLREIEEISPI